MESSGGSGQNRYGVTQFAGTNFGNWAYRVRIVLEEQGVDSVLTEDRQQDKAWKAKDAKAKSVVVSCIADSHLEHVKDCATAKAMMDKLRNTFEKTGLSAQVSARRKLLKLKATDKDELSKFFVKFEKAVGDLRMAGAEPNSVELVTTLLAAMPASYDGVASDIEASAGSLSSVTLEIAKTKLLNEEQRKKSVKQEKKMNGTANEQKNVRSANATRQGSGYQNNQKQPPSNNYGGLPPWTSYQSGYNNTMNPNIKCHNCAKPGHLRPNCPDLNSSHSNNRFSSVNSSSSGYVPQRFPGGRGRGYPINET
ncbi:unnamed protein product [Nesidiocoris tenuis]|uniref:Uncharacterized protein n=2 Tax=Nesidiocoris tenuis TaxID=355587 RepID=A0A6H5GHD3_9HEMI|nr:Hypothetical protein NTJ_00322 [Nesidiocoris tenuis]CAB0002298.1 unnamed protein product [Nesidiocoris tenuis]